MNKSGGAGGGFMVDENYCDKHGVHCIQIERLEKDMERLRNLMVTRDELSAKFRVIYIGVGAIVLKLIRDFMV